ncbi:MAG: glutamine amidotransferase, partial [Verrucomicrobiota bacterium]
VEENISISTVAIQPHGGQDQGVLSSIANQTGGRYYFPQDPALLPGIFIKEAKTLKRSMIQNKTFVPENNFPSPILKGITGMPELLGYVITSPKPRATDILVFPDEEEKDPVLSTWRYGLGKSAAFTSDLSPLWGESWVEWEKYRAFVKQLVTDISRTSKQSQLAVQSFADGSRGILMIEDHNPDPAHLTMRAEVTLPNRQTKPIPVKQVGPAMYQGEFPLIGEGHYQVMVAAKGRAEQPEHAVSGFSVPYSPEYLRFRSDPSNLKTIANDTNGRLLSGEETGPELFDINRKQKQRSRPVFDWFLWALAILIPLDVGIRRVQIDFAVIKNWLHPRREKETIETLSSLLKKKEDVGAQLKEQSRPVSHLPQR